MRASRRIALLIRSLNYGGTEMQVTILANKLSREGHAVSLLVFYPGGTLCGRLCSDMTFRCLEKRSRWHVISFLRTLFRVLAEERPDVLYSFLPVANVLACLAKFRLRRLKVAWGVRVSDMDLTRYDWLAQFSYWLERRLTRCPDLIIANSVAGRSYAVSRGFPDNDRFIVIPNGIDVQHFRPDVLLRETVRADWGILPRETLVGIVARLDPMKDYPTFLKAAAKLTQHEPGLRFVSVGTGPEDYAADLQEQARQLGLENRMIWAGPRGDLPAVYNAIDILVSSSAFGEGFSNVLGEAMASGVPCVATDVGGAHEILGDTGVVVPACDPDALATGIMALLKRLCKEGTSLKGEVRQRVQESFSVDALVRRTSAALEMVR